MNAIPSLVRARLDDMTEWRRDFHAHPEMAFEEHRTAGVIVDVLQGLGLEVETGIGGTGVVGTLDAGSGSTVGFRADMDALPIQEETGAPWASTKPGVMHACGHDGHCAMLLGAATALADAEDLRGTVRFIFQPAEENEAGARAMIEDGLFTRLPVDAVYALHNEPEMELGAFAVRAGPMMASMDVFEITIDGDPGHAARREEEGDAVGCAGAIVSGITELNAGLRPADRGVVRATQVAGGDSWNVIPSSAVIRGTARAFSAEARDGVEAGLASIVEAAGASRGCRASLRYERRYPPTVNSRQETELAIQAARTVSGEGRVHTDRPPLTASEDFAFMLEARPGSYALLGTGGGAALHTPRYDFNDEALGWGATYWYALARAVG
ncbi:MAG: amidohydrolase [Gemmatimonadota bacterium]